MAVGRGSFAAKGVRKVAVQGEVRALLLGTVSEKVHKKIPHKSPDRERR